MAGLEIITRPFVFMRPRAAGQVKNFIFSVKIIFSHVCQYFCDARQVHILRYFETWMVRGLYSQPK